MDQKLSFNRNDYDCFLNVLPQDLKEWVQTYPSEDVLELIVDLYRHPEIRLSTGKAISNADIEVCEEALRDIMSHSSIISSDGKNRYNIGNTLHRISVLEDLDNICIGVTMRVGRTFDSGILLFKDLIEEGNSILIIGAPGSGKSSRLREISRYISTNLDKRLMIVDTSNEIAGGHAKPHYAVGDSRRIMKPSNKSVHQCMLEAVENHMPEYLVIDEISNRAEAQAVQSIAERGIKIIATAHGNTLQDVLKNPEINNMLGRVKSVTVGDLYASEHNDGKKIKLEREFHSSFATAIELESFSKASVYREVELAIDVMFNGITVSPEQRDISRGVLNIVNQVVSRS